MRVFTVAGIHLEVNKFKHCGFEIELGKSLDEKKLLDFEGTFKAMLDRSDVDAVVIERFRRLVCEYLTQIYSTHDLSIRLGDWTFSLKYAEVDEKGMFWLVPATICGTFSDLRVTKKA